MQASNVNSIISNNNSINFKGFVDRSLADDIKRASSREMKNAVNKFYRDKEQKLAESALKNLKDAMSKMHPATVLYKNPISNKYLVLGNCITGKRLDIIRICDMDYNITSNELNTRFSAIPGGRFWIPGYTPNKNIRHPVDTISQWTRRSRNETIGKKDIFKIADNIKENASVYDKKLEVDAISEAALKAFKENEEQQAIKEKNKSKFQKFADKMLEKIRTSLLKSAFPDEESSVWHWL